MIFFSSSFILILKILILIFYNFNNFCFVLLILVLQKFLLANLFEKKFQN